MRRKMTLVMTYNIYLYNYYMNSRQLYLHNDLQVPELPPIQLAPFSEPQNVVEQKPYLKASLEQLFKRHTASSHFWAYTHTFEQICAKENLYPLMLKTSPSRLCVVCKDCLMLSEWSPNGQGQPLQGGDQLLVFPKWQRIKTPQPPTAVELGNCGLYVGYQSGRINQFLFRTRSWQGSSDQLQLPILQMHLFPQSQSKQQKLLCLDSAGNLILLSFSHKTFLDKIIKTMVSSRWISFMFKNKKRQKIKKLFRKIMNKEIETQINGDNSEMQMPYYYNSMAVVWIEQKWLVVVLRQNRLEMVVMEEDHTLISTTIVEVLEPSGEEKETPGWLQLGQGGFDNANTRHHVLIVGRSTTLSFFRVLQTEDTFQIVKVTQLTLPQPILFGKFISNNLIIIGNQQGLHLANIGHQPQQIIPMTLDKFSYIDFFMEEEGLEVDKQLLMGHLFGLLGEDANGSSLFVALEGKRLVAGCVLSWKAILLDLVCSSQWEQAASLFHDIYISQYSLVCGVNENGGERNAEMRELCEVIVKGYLQWWLERVKEKRNREKKQKKEGDESQESQIEEKGEFFVEEGLNNLIYFLLRCDYSLLMFSQCELHLSPLDLDPLFLSVLTPYLSRTNGLNLRLPFISEHYLQLVIRNYKFLHLEPLLQRFIMQLDLTQMQPLLLLGLCLREQLYRSLISICCQQKDYITPIIKLCGIGLSDPSKHSRTSTLTFWYLTECLAGKLTDYGNEQSYLQMLAVLINFIFIPSSLEMLLAADSRYLIRTIYSFFQPKIMRLILQNEDKFFMRQDGKGDPLFQDNCLSEFKLYENMLVALVAAVQGNQKKEDYDRDMYQLMVVLMLSNHFPFLPNFTLKVIRYFLGHPLLLSDSQDFQPELEQTVNGQLMRLLDCLLRAIEDKSLSLRQQANDDKSTLHLQHLLIAQKQKQLTSILQQITLSPFSLPLSQTKCYIHHQLGHYSTVLELYLRMSNKKIRNKLFLYLQHNLNKFQELTQHFLKYLLSLLGLQEDKCVRLLWCLREEWVEYEDVIDRLVDRPEIQLKYIEKAMAGEKRSKKLLLKHLEIVLREHSQDVEEFISKIEYPLEQAFRMCEESNNRMGKACILIKSGRNMEGVIIMSEIFLESVREYLPQLKKTGQADQEKTSGIMRQLGAVVATCHKEWTIDNDRGEDIWQKNTELIFKKLAVNNIDTPHVPDIIRNFLNTIITTLLSGMLEQVSTNFFLNRFVKTFSSLPQRLFLQAYAIIQHRLEFTFTLLKLNKDLVQQHELQTWCILMPTIYHAHICLLSCGICALPLTANDKMVSFICQHVMHEECYYQQQIKKTKNQLCPMCYSPLDSYMLCGDDKPLRYRLEVDEQELLRVKLGKMNYYDRMKNIGEMEQWGKFEEDVAI